MTLHSYALARNNSKYPSSSRINRPLSYSFMNRLLMGLWRHKQGSITMIVPEGFKMRRNSAIYGAISSELIWCSTAIMTM
jgi:hypothetical protein